MSIFNSFDFSTIVIIFMFVEIVPSRSVLVDSAFGSANRKTYNTEEVPRNSYSESWFPPSEKSSQRSYYDINSEHFNQEVNSGRTTASPSWLTTSESVNQVSRTFDIGQGTTGKTMPTNWYPSSRSFHISSRRFFDVQQDTGNPISSTWYSTSNEIQDAKNDSSLSWFHFLNDTEYRVIKGVLEECLNNDDTFICLKGKALTLLDRATKLKRISLFDGISFVREDNGTSSDYSANETDLVANFPRDLNEKNDKLNQMIIHHLVEFWNNHKFIVDYNYEDADEGGRQNKIKKKIKKFGKRHGYLLLTLLAGAGFVFPMMYKGLAALILKALLAAKIAFVLSGILLLSSFGHKSSHRSYTVEESEAADPWNSDRYSHAYHDNAAHGAYSAQIQRPVTISA